MYYNDTVDDEHLQDYEESVKKRSDTKFVIIFLIIILVPVLLYAGFVILFTWKTEYHIFTSSRTKEMEELFDIKVTKDVKLVHYKDSSFMTTIDKTLELEVKDYEKFIHNNIKDSVTQSTVSQIFKDTYYYEYKYVNHNIDVTVSPSNKKGKYTITLHYYD